MVILVRSLILVLSFVMVLGSSVPSYANFAQDWITNKTATGGGSFQGQQRGYIHGGTMSARWPSSSSRLIGLSKPKLSAGCGGIDLFAGGFSFLGFDYLVKKFQNMIMNAPAVIFDIALKALAEQLSSSIKSLDMIIETINGLQVDDCAATKNVLANFKVESAINDGIKNNVNNPDLLSGALNWTNTHVGRASSWVGTHEKTQSNPSAPPTTASVEESVSECHPTVMSDILMGGTGGSLLASLSAPLGYNAATVNLFRGLIGDVYVGTSTDAYKSTYHPGCSENSEIDIVQSIRTGQLHVKSSPTATCVPNPAAATYNLNKEALDLITMINAKLLSGVAFDDPEKARINAVSTPVYAVLKNAIQTQTAGTVTAELVNLVSLGMAYGFFADLFDRIQSSITLGLAAGSQYGPADGGSPPLCNQIFIDEIMEKMRALQAVAQGQVSTFGTALVAQLENVNTMNSFAATHREISQDSNRRVLQLLRGQ